MRHFFTFIFLMNFMWQPSAEAIQCPAFFFKKKELKSAPMSLALTADKFEKRRGLKEYIAMLPEDFIFELTQLGSADVWMDLGAGMGFAAQDFLNRFHLILQAPNVVLVAYKMKGQKKIPPYYGKLQILEGRLFEKIPSNELPTVSLVTDVFGVLSYTLDLEQSLNLIFSKLKTGGILYIHSRSYMTTIQMGQKNLSLANFLKTIPELEVIQSTPDVGIMKVIKKSDDVSVPHLTLVKVTEDGYSLPRRTFQVIPYKD